MEKIKKNKPIILVAFIIIAIFFAKFSIFLQFNLAKTLFPTEVRQYQGQNLSSINSVYENAIKGTQYISQTPYHLTVTGLVNKTFQSTYEDVVNNHQKYQKAVTIYCVEGWNAKILWESILVKDLLQEAGASQNAAVVNFSCF